MENAVYSSALFFFKLSLNKYLFKHTPWSVHTGEDVNYCEDAGDV